MTAARADSGRLDVAPLRRVPGRSALRSFDRSVAAYPPYPPRSHERLGPIAAARRLRRWYRLHRLAEVNGLSYVPYDDLPIRRGTPFWRGSARWIEDSLTFPGPPEIEVGRFRSVRGELPDLHTPGIGYLRMRVETGLPHLVLLSRVGRRPSGYSAGGMAFPTVQRIGFGPALHQHFEVFAPEGLPLDVPRAFPASFVGLILAAARGLDLELVDGDLYLYARRPFEIDNADELLLLRSLADNAVRSLGALRGSGAG